MRHGIKSKKLNRTGRHRTAMLVNMSVSLILHEQIATTLPKAKVLSESCQYDDYRQTLKPTIVLVSI